jgi:hypothetical protein
VVSPVTPLVDNFVLRIVKLQVDFLLFARVNGGQQQHWPAIFGQLRQAVKPFSSI